jgi:riboflavin biosynthesis pyrimidine reductase
VTITRSGRLPLDVRLFSEPEARVLVFSPESPPLTAPGASGSAAQVQHELLDQTTSAPLTAALRTLKERYGVRTLLCEGGPTLFGALLREGLVDSLFLTLAPRLVSGVETAVVSGPPPEVPASLELAGVMEHEGSLFLRYTLA